MTNICEDGPVPQVQQPNWKTLNTFRAQAQIAENGTACMPPKRSTPALCGIASRLQMVGLVVLDLDHMDDGAERRVLAKRVSHRQDRG